MSDAAMILEKYYVIRQLKQPGKKIMDKKGIEGKLIGIYKDYYLFRARHYNFTVLKTQLFCGEYEIKAVS